MHAPLHEGRRNVVLEIVAQVEALDGRFLKPTDQGDWIHVSGSEAKKKVSHALQYYQRTLRGPAPKKGASAKSAAG